MDQLPAVTVLVPMRNEEGFIESCLASLRAQQYPADRLTILVLDGESTDRSAAIVAAIAETDPRVRLLPNPGRTQAAGLNLGIREACGEIIVRADAHAQYGPSYVATCVAHLVAGEAENVGGLQRAEGTTPFSRALAVALGTPLGAGNAPYRLAKETRYADTVWLGAWRRETLRQLGGFNEAMPANEDYELNCRLRAQGGRILLDPALPSTYYPRSSPARLWRQYFRYGEGKVWTLRLHPGTLVLRQMVAPVLVAVVAMTAVAAVWSWLPLAAVLGVYLGAVFAGSALAARRQGWRHLSYLPLIFLTIHWAWGLGFLWELRRGGFPLRLRRIAQAERLVQKGTVHNGR